MSITVAGRTLEPVGAASDYNTGAMRPTYRLTIGDAVYAFAVQADGKTFVYHGGANEGAMFSTLEEAVEAINRAADMDEKPAPPKTDA